jgi:uncharacterized protein YcnI
MPLSGGVIPRALITAAVALALLLRMIVGSAPAAAHVHVDADDPARGEIATLTFRVPNESDSGSPTTALTVAVPNLTSVSTATMPGWTVNRDRDATAGTVQSVTWTAAPGSGIAAGEFGQFVMRVKLPDADTVSFPATQTYADGTVVRWDQPPLGGGAEPVFPAPILTLGPPGPPALHDEHHAPTATATSPADATIAETPAMPVNDSVRIGPDNVARALAGGALLLAALGLGITVVRRRS